MQLIDRAVEGIGLSTVFQPVVSLVDDAPVGFEALTRWPQLNNPSPDDVFMRASATGRLKSLNHLCVESAIRAALEAELSPGTLLLINTEPGGGYMSPADNEILARGQSAFHLVYELTERNILDHPRALLETVAALRADGIAIALDDVGAYPHSLTLLDIVEPDIVKLDRALIQSHLDREQIRAVNAVRDYRERTGAVVVAEGIETGEHRQRAVDLGASLGQGFKFGRPGPLRVDEPTAPGISVRPHRFRAAANSPFRLAAAAAPVRREMESTMLAMSLRLETRAQQLDDTQVVLAAFANGLQFDESMSQRYENLATSASLVAVFANGLPAGKNNGVRHIELDPTDPLCSEWVVLMLGAHTAAAIVGRESANSGHDRSVEKSFDVVTSTGRPVVSRIAHALLRRIR